MATKIILDCDPGHDDALAIMLAAAHPALELQAITTVHGNQTLEKVTYNALSVATLAGIDPDLPIAQGAARPLNAENQHSDYIHGETGLDGPELPVPNHTLSPHTAVDLITEIVRANPHEITLIPTGALTNIALFARLHPDLVPLVKEVVLMGGSYGRGNVTPSAEFNIYADPEAADIVFSESWEVTMVGLDVTHKALATEEVLDTIRSINTPAAEFAAKSLEFYGKSYLTEHGFPAPAVHDPVAVLRVIDPALVPSVKAPVSIELDGKHTRGKTVVDVRSTFCKDDPSTVLAQDAFLPGQGTPTTVAVDLDVDAFWEAMYSALRAL